MKEEQTTQWGKEKGKQRYTKHYTEN